MSDMGNAYKKRGVDYRSPTTLRTLPREYYQSEAIYAEELEKIFYKRWLLACRATRNAGENYRFEATFEDKIKGNGT